MAQTAKTRKPHAAEASTRLAAAGTVVRACNTPIPRMASYRTPSLSYLPLQYHKNGVIRKNICLMHHNSMLILMITAGQLRASRALLGIDQRALAEAAGLSLPTIQRMETSDGVIRGNVDSLMKLIAALDTLGIELITDNAASNAGGRGVRLKRPTL
jgi:hypothetical protein